MTAAQVQHKKVLFIVQDLFNCENSVTLVRKRTIPTERPPLVGQVSANICGNRVSRGQRNGSPRPHSRFSTPDFFNCMWQNYLLFSRPHIPISQQWSPTNGTRSTVCGRGWFVRHVGLSCSVWSVLGTHDVSKAYCIPIFTWLLVIISTDFYFKSSGKGRAWTRNFLNPKHTHIYI
jgi:hypothetical protein